MLLFTAPSRNWDWCLYETGLYTFADKLEKNEVSAVVCLFNPLGLAEPLADLQGARRRRKAPRFFDLVCRERGRFPTTGARGAGTRHRTEKVDARLGH
jgi:hypothetical protein